MKAIRFSLLAGAVLAVTGVAVAQPGTQPRGPAAEVTRDEAVARADARFQRLDVNRDGRVTTDELRQAGEARQAQRAERGAERQTAMFDRLDADRSGQISREEFAQRREMRGERRGRGGMHGIRSMRGGARGGAMGARMLGDDGVMTADEFRARAATRFDRLDANRDGRVTADERRGARERMRTERRERRQAPAQQQ